jgi:hypothetical protein
VADSTPEVDQQAAGDSLTVEGQRFAIVPEWVIDADVGDCAFRLYAVLLRYGQSSGARMPSRATLARRLRKRSVDTVDRAMKELVALGAVVVERRHDGKQNLTNLYHVRTTGPGRTTAATSRRPRAGRTDAAGGLPDRAATPGRSRAVTPAAAKRPDPESLTQEQPPPPVREVGEEGLDFADLAESCRDLRRALGLPTGLWTEASMRAAYARAVTERGWPATAVDASCRAVAADPATRSPMRVAEAGPWWDAAEPPLRPPEDAADELAELKARLDAVDGRRILYQRRAREALAAEGLPLTRTTVVRRAVSLLAGTP